MKERFLSHLSRMRRFCSQGLSICIVALVVLSVPKISAQVTAQRSSITSSIASSTVSSIDGYWELTAEFQDYDLNTEVCFKTSANPRAIEGIVLGPTSGRPGDFIGEFSGNELSITVPGPLGKMQVTLTFSGDTLSGTWVTGELSGKVRGIRTISRKPEPDYYPKYLKTVCQIIKDNFYDSHFNGVDIEKSRAKYAEQLTHIKDDADFVKLIRRLLGEFKASHLDFYLAPQHAPMVEKTPPITFRRLSAETWYLRIRDFDPLSPQAEQDFNQSIKTSIEAIAGTPSLIIDLRGNRGGNLGLVFRSLTHFLEPGQDASYAFVRSGADRVVNVSTDPKKGAAALSVVHSSSDSMIAEIVRNGAAVIRIDDEHQKRYRGRIVILVDERCYSGCELFSAILQQKGKATLIGSRTGGEVLGSYTDTLVKNLIVTKKDTGWRLEVPIIDFRIINGERLEGRGVRPDIEVLKKGKGDPALAEALRYLEHSSARNQ